MMQRRGFMLVELVIALALLAMVVVALWGALSQLTQTHRDLLCRLERTQCLVAQHEGGVQREEGV
jgi:type II secretory pathway component PulJ